jgi:hypothetical protein
VKVRDIAEFRADFPDDSIEDEHGFVRYPGLGVAEAIAQMCRDMGFRVAAPEGEAELGWVFDVHVGKRRYWFRLSDLGDRIILISRDMTRYEPTPGDIGHEELLSRLDAAMKADGRFGSVAWFTDAEYRRAGEETAPPVRIKLPPALRLTKFARAAILVGVVLVVFGFAFFELWTAHGFFADGHMKSSGVHALAGVGSVVFLFWGFRKVVEWLDARRL